MPEIYRESQAAMNERTREIDAIERAIDWRDVLRRIMYKRDMHDNHSWSELITHYMSHAHEDKSQMLGRALSKIFDSTNFAERHSPVSALGKDLSESFGISPEEIRSARQALIHEYKKFVAFVHARPELQDILSTQDDWKEFEKYVLRQELEI